MPHNIPLELRLAPRWCFTGKESDLDLAKAPHFYNEELQAFEMLSVHDYHRCMPFDELELLLAKHPERGFGFILVDGDGYTCVDLDVKDSMPVDASRRHFELINGLDTYTEVSRSGVGVHMWLKGEINGAIKTNEMEVYSRERFIICTGNVILDRPIAHDPDVLEFFNARAKESAESFNFVDVPQTKSDEQIMEEALYSDHSGKLACLMSGDWDGYCSIMHSQGARDFTFDPSQADSAFMTIVTYYTRNVEQCKRLWRTSALGDVEKRYPGNLTEQRKKARNMGTDYKLLRAIAYGIQKNDRDSLERERLAAEAREQNKAIVEKAKLVAKGAVESLEGTVDPVAGEQPFPPGMMGELARYFDSQSIKPIRDFAIAEALAVAAGLFGRCYNISGTGLNTYIMMLAPSGSGKSALSKNPENLMTLLERSHGVIGARQFIMSKRFTHENAMFQEFKERSQFTQCLSEFGKVFKNMVSDSNQGGALGTVRECMTDMFSKSGQFDVAGGMRYATAERSVDLGYPVGYSFLGESVPEPFFESITPDMFTDGFMSRFLIMHYEGEVPYDTIYQGAEPPQHLLQHLIQATTGATRALMDINSVAVTQVGMDAYAGKWFADFSRECTDKVNEHAGAPVIASLWTRANLKVLKVAGLLATMDCPSQPIVNKSHIDWAHDFVMRHNYIVFNAMRQGRMANATESESLDTLREILISFYTYQGSVTAYHAKAEQMRTNGHIPWGYVQRIATRRACFKSSQWKKPTQLIRETIEELKRAGVVRQLSKQETTAEYNTTADIFQVIQ
ncbi:DNA primase [Vibrio phage K251 g3]